jgi:hypothetical protein
MTIQPTNRVPHPRCEAAGRDPRRAVFARWGGAWGIARKRDRLALAVASRYPKASALGLSGLHKMTGFSPWGMPSYPEAKA